MSPINVLEEELEELDDRFKVKESKPGEAVIVTHPEGFRRKYSKYGFDPDEVSGDAQEFLEELKKMEEVI